MSRVPATRAFATGILVAALLTTLPLAAQEIVDLTGRDQRLDADFEEVFRVGVLNGESWEMFGAVRNVAFDASGNLYLFDGLGGPLASGGRVLVFDPAGNFVREFGSSGEGPGEFNRPGGFAVMRDGTTVVSDAGHRAYQLFDAEGNFMRMVRTGDGPQGTSISGDIRPDPRGGAVFRGGFGTRISFSMTSGAEMEPPTSRPVMRHGLEGEVVRADTVVDGWLPPREELSGGLPANMRVGGRTVEVGNILSQMMPVTFEPRLLAGVLPDGGIVHSDSSAYALKVTAPGASEVARIIRRPLRPEPVTESIKEDYVERRDAAREERGGIQGSGIVMMRSSTGGTVNQSAPSMSFDMPEARYYHELPVLRGLSTTWGGRIWVQRRGDEPEADGPIDVLTAEGDYVGTFPTDATEMPDAFGPNGMAAFIELDDFDVASVVVRRLPAAVR